MSGSGGYNMTDLNKETHGVFRFRLGEKLNKGVVFRWFYSVNTMSTLQMKLLQGLKA